MAKKNKRPCEKPSKPTDRGATKKGKTKIAVQEKLQEKKQDTLEHKLGQIAHKGFPPLDFPPLPMGQINPDYQENIRYIAARLRDRLRDEQLQSETINTILAEVVTGAYLDRKVIYTFYGKRFYLEDLERLQTIRQKADTHLLNVIRVYWEITRPPINVVVKQAGQVNVGEQIDQSKQQVNIGKQQQANINDNKQSA